MTIEYRARQAAVSFEREKNGLACINAIVAFVWLIGRGYVP